MKALFIGGTGVISSACSQFAVADGIELYVLNRGQTSRPVPKEVQVLYGDIRDKDSVAHLLNGHVFDVVVNWVAFTPDHIETDIELFRGRTGQYIFISSASAYQTPPANLPVTESTLLDNPHWDYSQAKIACEDRLIRAYREEKFPITIIRPSHTYDRTMLPVHGAYTVINRMRQGKKVIVPGDGTSLWVLTHHRDFAKGFVGLLGNHRAIGEIFHITSDEILTWNQIYQILARAAGVRAADAKAQVVHVPSDCIAAFDQNWGVGLLGDKSHSMIFDNTKIKRFVPDFAATIPFSRGAEEIIAWFDADPTRQAVNDDLDRLMDRIITAYETILPKA